MTQTPVHKESFRVRCYETDPAGRLTLPSLLDLFQEAAWNHAHHLGISVPQLQAQGLTWVMFRLHVRVDRYPYLGETVTLETWPSGVQGLRFFRDFRVLDAGGLPLALGTTAFMILDLERRRPVKLQDERVRFPVHRVRALDDPFDRLSPPARDNTPRCFTVYRSDLDVNRHANATAYARWCLECPPADGGREPVPASLQIHYQDECFLGDTLSVGTQAAQEDPMTLHHALERGGQTPVPVALAVSRWRPLPAERAL